SLSGGPGPGAAFRHRRRFHERVRPARGGGQLRLCRASSATAEIIRGHGGRKGKKMKTRMDYHKKAPELMKAVLALSKAVDECGLEKSLLHLIKLRASQINGCSYCVDM